MNIGRVLTYTQFVLGYTQNVLIQTQPSLRNKPLFSGAKMNFIAKVGDVRISKTQTLEGNSFEIYQIVS